MPIDPTKVALAVHGGLSIVCATCERYWGARDRGIPGDTCLSDRPCGGPLAGDTFHNYRGPMTQFDQFCFACGDQATKVLRVKGHVRPIGCCNDHERLVRKLKPENRPAVNLVVISEDEVKSSEELSAKKEPTVLKFRSGDGKAT
jgi:hypothetical protein